MTYTTRRLASVLGWILLLVSFAGTISNSGAQPAAAIIAGSVVDKGEGVPIAYAYIWIHEQSGNAFLAVQPDRFGKFRAQISEGYYDIMIAAPGFAPICKSVRVKHEKPVVLNVRLGPDEENLQDN
jgi:hypothetical protein